MFSSPTQVIDSKLHLITIHCPGIRTNSHACIVNQVVKSLLRWKNRICTWQIFKNMFSCILATLSDRVCACETNTHCCRCSQQTDISIWCQPDPAAWRLPWLHSYPSWCQKQLVLLWSCLCMPESPEHLQRRDLFLLMVNRFACTCTPEFEQYYSFWLSLKKVNVGPSDCNQSVYHLIVSLWTYEALKTFCLPLAARSLTVSLPIPVLPPVTIAVFPSRFTSEVHLRKNRDLRKKAWDLNK